MPVVVTVDMRGVTRMTKRMRGRLNNLRPALKSSGAVLVQSIQKNIQKGGRPDKWEGLSDMTKNMRRKGSGKGEPQVLRDTGALMNSIVPLDTGRDYIHVGSTLDYARRHVFGEPSSIHGIKVPVRDFLMVQDSDVERITTIFRDHIFG